MKPQDPLHAYRAKRDVALSGEPSGERPLKTTGSTKRRQPLLFVVQKHWAGRLHYDFRLEIGGTLKSWAVPKGPCLDPDVKRMAIHVEDHPLAYAEFEGTIPKGAYGAGEVLIWDQGTWQPDGDPEQAYRDGKLKFHLQGRKLLGRWALVRTHDTHWLLIKEKDAHARAMAAYDITLALPDSVTQQGVSRGAPLPQAMLPQLATRVSSPPSAPGWCYELKFDGYRLLTRIHQGQACFMTRNGHDWTQRMPTLSAAFQSQPFADGWYDGELVVLDAQGRPDFQALQNALDPGLKESGHLVYFLFDLLWLKDEDLRALPFQERRARLTAVWEQVQHPDIRLSEVFDVPARAMLQSACELGLEGVIGKRKHSPYIAGRNGHWIKLKCGERQEFVVGGYTDPQGGRSGLGALLLGTYDHEGRLQYAGKVGSGFDETTLQRLHRRLAGLHQPAPAFVNPPREQGLHWVRPSLAVEVAFSAWTASGRVRHAVFLGMRQDKDPRLMTKEQATPISNADRMMDKQTRTRKGDIAAYYERLAPLIMPHLEHRPVSLLRAPDGLEGEQFFQKHMSTGKLSGVMELDPALDPGHEPLVVVRHAAGLAQAAQLNVIEFHTWNAVRSRLDRPDRISFDLDPGEGVTWAAMQEAALLLRNFLHELGLPAFLKTSGGKGLHVLVPIIRRYEWDTVKGFSRAVVQHMAEVLPQRFSAKSGPRNRVGKIFIDYLRNGFGATTVSAWSLRARAGMGVSVPVEWEEVNALSGGDHWTIQNIDERLEVGNRPWKEYANSAAALGPAMKRLG